MTKRTFVLTLILMLFALCLYAQSGTESENRVAADRYTYRMDSYLKVFGSGLIPFMSTNDVTDDWSRQWGAKNRGFQIGISFTTEPIYEFVPRHGNLWVGPLQGFFREGDFLLLEPGIRYITKGAEATYRYEAELSDYNFVYVRHSRTEERTVNFHYLDAFCKLKYANINHPVQPFIGLSGSYLLSAKQSFDKVDRYDFIEDSGYEDYTVYDKSTVNMKRGSSPFDVSLLLGMEMIIGRFITLEYEFNMGLVHIDDADSGRMDGKHQTHLLSLGVKLY